MSHPQCLACGQHRFAPLYEGTLLRCGSCGFVTANMDVDEDVLRRVYNTNFFDGEEVYDYLGTKDSRQLNFHKRLGRVLRVVDRDRLLRVLEIGAAYGFFGEVLLRDLPGASYTGIDVAQEATRHGHEVLGLDLECGDYLKREYPEPFTGVFLWDVIEHLARPQDFVCKIHGDLAAGGHLVIGTPDIGMPLPKLRGRRWRNIHPPSHLQYFSAQTLRIFLERHGFEVLAVLHPPVWRSAKLIFHFIVQKRWNNALTRGLSGLIPRGLTIPLNTYDNMIVIARKLAGDKTK